MYSAIKQGVILLVSVAVLTVTVPGCSTSTIIVGQSLKSKDRNLSSVKNNLAVLTVNVESVNQGEYFVLNSAWATNTSTQQSYSFALFSNFILGTSKVPHEINGNQLQQTIFLDLPAGKYTIDRLNMVTLRDHLADGVPEHYVYRPYPKLAFEVSADGIQHFGQLNIRVMGVEQVGSEFRSLLRLIPRSISPADVAQLQERFPALVDHDVKLSRMQQ